MSRRKNLQTLRGMNNTPRTVWVVRGGRWKRIVADQLLPGDIVSITRAGASEDVIPADCLILKGSAVVNEATLTGKDRGGEESSEPNHVCRQTNPNKKSTNQPPGESVPQMKEAVLIDDATRTVPLELMGAHKVHVLFGGTRVLQHGGTKVELPPGAYLGDQEEDEADEDEAHAVAAAGQLPAGSPDGGCICFVLRTGFDSSQGNMVRMIEFSSEKVSSGSYEALALVLFLLTFALIASGYVLKRGLEDDRDQFDLLLHCILVVTSVVPPGLPLWLC